MDPLIDGCQYPGLRSPGPVAAPGRPGLTRTMRRSAHAVAVGSAVLALTLAGCSSDSSMPSLSQGFDFRHDDPSGYLACRDLALAELTPDDAKRERLLATAAASAAASQSAVILDTVDPEPPPVSAGERIGTARIGDFTVDPEALHQACEESDFNFTYVDEDDLSGT